MFAHRLSLASALVVALNSTVVAAQEHDCGALASKADEMDRVAADIDKTAQEMDEWRDEANRDSALGLTGAGAEVYVNSVSTGCAVAGNVPALKTGCMAFDAGTKVVTTANVVAGNTSSLGSGDVLDVVEGATTEGSPWNKGVKGLSMANTAYGLGKSVEKIPALWEENENRNKNMAVAVAAERERAENLRRRAAEYRKKPCQLSEKELSQLDDIETMDSDGGNLGDGNDLVDSLWRQENKYNVALIAADLAQEKRRQDIHGNMTAMLSQQVVASITQAVSSNQAASSDLSDDCSDPFVTKGHWRYRSSITDEESRMLATCVRKSNDYECATSTGRGYNCGVPAARRYEGMVGSAIVNPHTYKSLGPTTCGEHSVVEKSYLCLK